jgi:hypothetical protein
MMMMLIVMIVLLESHVDDECRSCGSKPIATDAKQQVAVHLPKRK